MDSHAQSRPDEILVLRVPLPEPWELTVSRRLCISGDPKYGVPVLDPMYVPEISVQESGIKITAWNFTIEGARNATLQDFR